MYTRPSDATQEYDDIPFESTAEHMSTHSPLDVSTYWPDAWHIGEFFPEATHTTFHSVSPKPYVRTGGETSPRTERTPCS